MANTANFGSKDPKSRLITKQCHLASKMILFADDMAREGLKHCLDTDSWMDPFQRPLRDPGPRPILNKTWELLGN